MPDSMSYRDTGSARGYLVIAEPPFKTILKVAVVIACAEGYTPPRRLHDYRRLNKTHWIYFLLLLEGIGCLCQDKRQSMSPFLSPSYRLLTVDCPSGTEWSQTNMSEDALQSAEPSKPESTGRTRVPETSHRSYVGVNFTFGIAKTHGAKPFRGVRILCQDPTGCVSAYSVSDPVHYFEVEVVFWALGTGCRQFKESV